MWGKRVRAAGPYPLPNPLFGFYYGKCQGPQVTGSSHPQDFPFPCPIFDAFTQVETSAKNQFVILSEAKDLVFMRFFGRFAPSE